MLEWLNVLGGPAEAQAWTQYIISDLKMAQILPNQTDWA